MIPIIFTIQNGEPLSFALPYFFLFTPFRKEAKFLWKLVSPSLTDRPKAPPEHIPVINFKDYSYEKLREVSENFRHPTVVRGIFAGTPAVENWGKKDYLKSYLGHFELPITLNASIESPQNNHAMRSFSDAWDKIYSNDTEKTYMFFPQKNRPLKKHYDGHQRMLAKDNEKLLETSDYARVSKAVNNLALQDLQIDKKIWPGFGTPVHKSYLGAQLIIGMGKNDSEQTTGSAWHCAMGGNFFIQIVGRKRWYFMDPKFSALFKPLRIGTVAFMINEDYSPWYLLHPHLPLRYVDLQPGDMIYNPDYQWHTIQNYEGLTVGMPIRDFNVSKAFRNNLLFSSVAISNKLFERMGYVLKGFPDEIGELQFD